MTRAEPDAATPGRGITALGWIALAQWLSFALLLALTWFVPTRGRLLDDLSDLGWLPALLGLLLVAALTWCINTVALFVGLVRCLLRARRPFGWSGGVLAIAHLSLPVLLFLGSCPRLRVVDAAGQPVAGARVVQFFHSFEEYSSPTDEDGYTRLVLDPLLRPAWLSVRSDGERWKFDYPPPLVLQLDRENYDVLYSPGMDRLFEKGGQREPPEWFAIARATPPADSDLSQREFGLLLREILEQERIRVRADAYRGSDVWVPRRSVRRAQELLRADPRTHGCLIDPPKPMDSIK